MIEKTKQISDLQQMLEENGLEKFSALLQAYVEKNDNTNSFIVGFVGDDLVGKSTVVNAVLERDLLPTSIIPSEAEIAIRYGSDEIVIAKDGSKTSLLKLKELCEDEKSLDVIIDSPFIKDNNLKLVEFHGTINTRRVADIAMMPEILQCNAIVLVVAADRLFSNPECKFIENYVKYVGADHLLVLISKLSLIPNSETDEILDFASKKASSKFPNVKIGLFGNKSIPDSPYESYSGKQLQDILLSNCKPNNTNDNQALFELLTYIEQQITGFRNEFKAKSDKEKEAFELEKEKMLNQKTMKEAEFEKAFLDFKLRGNKANQAIDAYIKDGFSRITKEILSEFESAENKYTWYESQLETSWKNKTIAFSNEVDKYVMNIIEKDVRDLNAVFQADFSVDPIRQKMPELPSKVQSKSYDQIKKMLPIGIGGLAVIGFCFLNIVGAVFFTAFGAGVYWLISSFLNAKDSSSTDEMRSSISSGIRDISTETRKATRNEITKRYDNILNEFKNEVDRYMNANFTDIETTIHNLVK